ncbi:MAG TPA: hypothetical protein VMG10_13010 [Gemmataceae bacterium]|nr:hypothetical protein [Gemmataceae bacterium]
MAYSMMITDADRDYLDQLPLSPTARGRVEDFIDYAIANVTDAFRNDPGNRPRTNAPYFQVDFFILDTWGDGCYHKITFIVSDEHATAGVLAIVYVDHVDHV